jgi:hypothetical protein
LIAEIIFCLLLPLTGLFPTVQVRNWNKSHFCIFFFLFHRKNRRNKINYCNTWVDFAPKTIVKFAQIIFSF